jgi:hypothetical protein
MSQGRGELERVCDERPLAESNVDSGYLRRYSYAVIARGCRNEWSPHVEPLPLPRSPRPMPLPARPPVDPLRLRPRPVCPPTPTYPPVVDVVVEAPRPLVTLPLPLVLALGAASALRRSSSSLLAAASLLACSSAARRSAACCRYVSSSSMATKSCDAPCHCGFRMSRWLCSVWDKMRVHVWSRVEAFWTVLETV